MGVWAVVPTPHVPIGGVILDNAVMQELGVPIGRNNGITSLHFEQKAGYLPDLLPDDDIACVQRVLRLVERYDIVPARASGQVVVWQPSNRHIAALEEVRRELAELTAHTPHFGHCAASNTSPAS